MKDIEPEDATLEETKEDLIAYIRNINDKGVIEYLKTYVVLANTIWNPGN